MIFMQLQCFLLFEALMEDWLVK